MSVRIKSILTMVLGSLLGTFFLWNFNIFYVLRNWSLYTDGLSLFAIIVFSMIITASIIMWKVLKPVAQAEKVFANNEELTQEEDHALAGAISRMPMVLSMIGGIGFFLGPLIKKIVTLLKTGSPLLSQALFTSILFSVAIGLYATFIEIRMVEGHFYGLQMQRKRTSISQTKKRKWASRQLLVGFTIMFLAVGLFYAAGIGYLEDELLAPGNLDGISSASESSDYRVEIWTKALEGQSLNLDEHHPAIAGRLQEYMLKMILLALVVLFLSWLAVSIENKPTQLRLEELNLRLQEIASGDARKDNKLVIIRGDDLGLTVHWINRFIDKQADTMSTILHSIRNLDGISSEMGEILLTGNALETAIGESIEKVLEDLEEQLKDVHTVSSQTAQLQDLIVKTNENLQNQNSAVNSNSAAVEEMVANIGSVSRNARNAYEQSRILSEQADTSSQEMSLLLKGMEDISATAVQVDNSVGQIAKLAAQTNLLAMNAAIEAAHAGDVGAGFAVVATEVRSLAENSSITAKKIGELIHKMNELSDRGVHQATAARESFSLINQSVQKNMLVISEISEAMSEQEKGSEEMHRAMEQLEDLTRDAASISEKEEGQSQMVSASMKNLQDAASSIQSQMEQNASLNGDLNSFLHSLKEIIERNTQMALEMRDVSKGHKNT